MLIHQNYLWEVKGYSKFKILNLKFSNFYDEWNLSREEFLNGGKILHFSSPDTINKGKGKAIPVTGGGGP
jgi:hypothetical protein